MFSIIKRSTMRRLKDAFWEREDLAIELDQAQYRVRTLEIALELIKRRARDYVLIHDSRERAILAAICERALTNDDN